MATRAKTVGKKVKKGPQKKTKEFMESDAAEMEDVELQLIDVGCLMHMNSRELKGSQNISCSRLLFNSTANREDCLYLDVSESAGRRSIDADIREANSGLAELTSSDIQQYSNQMADMVNVELKRTIDKQRIEICQLQKELCELQVERIDMVRSVCSDIVSAMSVCTTDQFTERIEVLRQLIEIWSQGEDVDVKCNEPTTVTATVPVDEMKKVIGDNQPNVYVKVDCKARHMTSSVVDKEHITDGCPSQLAVITDRYTGSSAKFESYRPPVMPRRKPGEPVVPFPCTVCGKTFRFYSQLEQHKRYHAGVRPWVCGQCGRRFALQCSRDKHATIHSSDRPLMCDVCGQRFAHKNYLKSHQRIHEQDRPCHTCLHCNRQFAHAASLRHHVSVKHPTDTDEQFTCHHCGQVFTNVIQVRTHLRQHTGETSESFDCEMCSEVFETPTELEKHLKAAHTASETRTQNSRRYPCRLCSRNFSQPANLRRHMLVHTGVRPWVCQLCGRRFTQPGNLKSHLRIHTGERPFVCLGCGRQFTEATTLRKHTLRHCPVAVELRAAVANSADDDDDDNDDNNDAAMAVTEAEDVMRISLTTALDNNIVDCTPDEIKLQFT